MNHTVASKPAVPAHDETASTIRPSQAEAEDAVRVLLRWVGEDVSREGLIDTPKRVAKAYKEMFRGYDMDPADILKATFDEAGGYDEIIALTNIRFYSHCEHHILPITGQAHVAYLPANRVVGVSKIARLVDMFASRMQIQERLTAQVADAIQDVLQPRGVAVVIEAQHQCMTMRGVKKSDGMMKTSRMLGAFRDDPQTRNEFFAMIDRSRG